MKTALKIYLYEFITSRSFALQIVGTAVREIIPDVPMFNATPAKRPRRETLKDTITAVGQTIASALTPGASSSGEPEVNVEQVRIIVCDVYAFNYTPVMNFSHKKN